MALTTATVAPAKTHQQPGTLGARRARLVTVTFTAGYDSTTGVTLTAASVGLSEIYAIVPCGAASTGAVLGNVLNTPASSAVITLWNGTTKVATSDQSATTALVLVYGV